MKPGPNCGANSFERHEMRRFMSSETFLKLLCGGVSRFNWVSHHLKPTNLFFSHCLECRFQGFSESESLIVSSLSDRFESVRGLP